MFYIIYRDVPSTVLLESESFENIEELILVGHLHHQN